MRPTPTLIQKPTSASTPPDTRIYAVGDIHGRADLLNEITERIDDDLRRRPVRYVQEVYLGDYIDRGPDSKGVIDQLAVRMVRQHAICLRGNHETFLETFFYDPAVIDHWIQLGALHTLASYGIFYSQFKASPYDLQQSLLHAFPRTHQLFLRCLRNSFTCGDFLFVHAGIKPGISIEHQQTEDLFWIRDEFLNSTLDHGKIVVHGHTPVDHAEIFQNRINIDTGAWRTGVLTCIAIEGDRIVIL
ncbi:serine/threonine protein phosphatase 1 [Nitrobacteraceae bacterium AZCC 1564]